MNQSEAYLTGQGLAERYHRSAQTIARWRKAGKGPKPVKIGGRILYPIADVLRFEQEEAAAEDIAVSSDPRSAAGRVVTSLPAGELAESDDHADIGVA